MHEIWCARGKQLKCFCPLFLHDLIVHHFPRRKRIFPVGRSICLCVVREMVFEYDAREEWGEHGLDNFYFVISLGELSQLLSSLEVFCVMINTLRTRFSFHGFLAWREDSQFMWHLLICHTISPTQRKTRSSKGRSNIANLLS